MADLFLKLPAGDRREALGVAAASSGRPLHLLDKDVWLVWILLGLVYAPVAIIVAYINDRELSWRGGWRLASAAQMTGALLMSLVILLYGLQVFDLIQFIFFFGLHFFVAWVYVFAAPFFLPPVTEVPAADPNPFEPT